MNETGQNIKNKRDEIIASYISKDEFLNIITNTDFVCIKEADLELLTGVIYNVNDNTFRELSKIIRIS